jgi:hypothetical protein
MQNTTVAGDTSVRFGLGVSEAGTRVNSRISLQAGNALANVTINTGIGRDVIQTGGNVLTGNLSVNSSLGNDDISIGALGHDDVGGNLTVNAGLGNDRVAVNDVDVTGSANIDLGIGDDTLVIASTGAVDIGGATTINDGIGSDTVRIGDLTGGNTAAFHGDVTINAGIVGNDSIGIGGLLTAGGAGSTSSTTFDGNLSITGGVSADCVGLDGVVVGQNLAVNTGVGNDFVGAVNVAVLGNVSVDTGIGNDTVSIGLDPNNIGVADPTLNFVGGTTTVNTGAGNDVVLAENTTFTGNVTVNTAAGADKVAGRNNIFNADLSADGGAGTDVGDIDVTNVVAGTTTTTNFESDVLAEGIVAYENSIIAKAKACFPDIFP